jgi:hypothetical protein
MAMSNAESIHQSNIVMLPRRAAQVYLELQAKRIRRLQRELGMAA